MVIKGLSSQEMKLASELEFKGNYYFTRKDIAPLFENEKQITNALYGLKKKERIIKLNRSKYYFIPIKARSGKWIDDIPIAIDEILDGQDYFIGGWFASNSWRLTDQIPFQADVYTTRRQGKVKIFNMRIIFHRTSKRNLKKAIVQKIQNHNFFILNKKEAGEWMKSRE
jgi:predicted transcriptional regulator of viral defense system